MSTRPLRFGIWALVHGSRAAYQDPEEPYDASWERNRDLVLAAEALGYDSTLIAQHTINPHREDFDQLEAWSAAAAVAALTSRIEIIAAIKPYLYHPVVLAKLALGIENISRGRFAINLVNAWNRPELDKAGIGFAEHDARYAYGREWITIVSRLMQGERLTYKGEHFDVRDYLLRPTSLYRPRPLIYVGGESEPARALVADHGRRLVHQWSAARGCRGPHCRRGGAAADVGAASLRAVRLRHRAPDAGRGPGRL
ncbi:LLM class flavin-dependent oxidoreductase [Bradyrhizobium sp. USDA 4506]